MVDSVKNGLWLFSGNIVYAFNQWLVLVILSHFFTKEELGSYFLSLAIVAPLAILFSLKLPNLIIVLEESLTREKNIFFCRIILSFILIFSSYFIYFSFFYDNTSFITLTSVLIYKILEQNDDVTSAYFQKIFLFKNIFILKIFRSTIYIFLLFISSLYFNSIESVLVFSTIGYAVFWIFRNRNYFRSYSFSEEKQYLVKYFKSGSYLALSASMSSLSVSGVRLYVGYVLGNYALAIYGVISYTLIVFSIVVSALGQYFLPLFSNNKNNMKKFNYYILQSQFYVFFLGCLCVLVSFYLGGELLKLFYGDEYSGYGLYLCLIFIANIFKSSSALIGTAMTARNIYNFQLKFTIISLILTVILLPIFISKFEILGAFLTLGVVGFLEWILYLVFTCNLIKRFSYENL